jgi:OPA family sugar phosphate sensor protein UhpC-like MFS transporter
MTAATPRAPGQTLVLGLTWLVYGSFYLNKLNLAPVIPLLLLDQGLSHAQVGLVSASFFAAYALSQVGWGFLSDRFGPRRIITLGGLIAVAGNLFFGLGLGPAGLMAGQAVNGLGQGGGFGPSVQLLNAWFRPSQSGRVLGLYTTSISLFTLATYPLAGWLGQAWGWRAAFLLPPAWLALVMLTFHLLVRDRPPGAGSPRTSPALERFNLRKEVTGILSRDFLLAGVGFLCLTYIS